MRFLQLVLDVAAVAGASRSVAAKHVALRGRQLESLSKTSALAGNWKSQRPSEPSSASTAASAPPVSQAISARAATQDASPRVAHIPHISPDQPASSRIPTAGLQANSHSALSQLREEKDFKPPTTDAAFAEPGASSPSANVDEADLPPGVNVDIFHTKRGSGLLGDLAKNRKRQQPAGLPEFVKHSFEKPAETKPAATSAAAPSPTPTTPHPAAGSTQKAASDKEVEALAESLAQEPLATTPSHVVKSTAAESSPKPHVLRESRVPSSRLGRIWNYGGLAAGMMGGAITESIGRAFGGQGQGSVMLSAGNMERLVSKLSQMRGAALKFGQMLSFQDSKMLPGPIQEVLQRVQDRADYMPAWQRDKVMAANLGPNWRDLFEEFEEKPMAAASIGQVHKATLKANGQRVAVKIQFPGVADSINSDLDNLGILLTATKLLPKGLYLNKTIDNARLELGWECDYEREAECATRYQELLRDEPGTFLVPKVYPEASGKQVLTMDFMDGTGVTRIQSFTQDQKDWIGTQILRLCLREITEFHFMQTDPNWTNFLYNAGTNKLELLDFGASREFPDKFVTQYVRLLAAASRSDREGVRDFSEKLGYLTGHESKTMIDAHVDSVLTLAEPFLESAPEVYDFEDQTITDRVRALIPVMLNERLAPPPEETYSLHRKLSGAFLLCAKLGSKVRCRDMFQDSLKRTGYM